MGNSNSSKEEKRTKSNAQTTTVRTVRTVRIVSTDPTVRTVSTVPTGQTNPTVPIVPSVALPPPFSSRDEFFENWKFWKQNFLQYRASNAGSTQTDWENTLLNLMGPIGQNIYTSFKVPYQSGNLDILFREFDDYYVFAGKRRLPRESIYEYMEELQTIVRKKEVQDGEDVIRDRIKAEINESEFISAAKKLIPTFAFSTTYNTLTMKEITFLWDFCISQKNCRKCGNEHGPDNCPAIGKQCHKCNKFDHYTRRCPNFFVFECRYCGGMHRVKYCPAYNETCTKCNRPNHFYWKCLATKIKQCHFCGLTHIADRSQCPANNTHCIYCNLKGHFSTKCRRRPQPRQI